MHHLSVTITKEVCQTGNLAQSLRVGVPIAVASITTTFATATICVSRIFVEHKVWASSIYLVEKVL